jgi:hypothetical protein
MNRPAQALSLCVTVGRAGTGAGGQASQPSTKAQGWILGTCCSAHKELQFRFVFLGDLLKFHDFHNRGLHNLFRNAN